MNTHTDKSSENKIQPVAGSLSSVQTKSEPVLHAEGNQSGITTQNSLQEAADKSPRVKQLKAYQAMADEHIAKATQLKGTSQREVQKKQGRVTGIRELQSKPKEAAQRKPQDFTDTLASGFEHYSRMDFDSFPTNINSSTASQFQKLPLAGIDESVVQRTIIPTNDGTFNANIKELSDQKQLALTADTYRVGAEINISFSPDNTLKGTRIGLIQSVQSQITKLGNNNPEFDVINPGIGNQVKGIEIDVQKPGKRDSSNSPVYGAIDIAANPAAGLEAVPEPNGEDNKTGSVSATGEVKPAKLRDSPARAIKGLDKIEALFETTALVLSGPQNLKGKYLGSFNWGYKWDSPARLATPIEPNLKSKGDPSDEFYEAAKAWNEGTIKRLEKGEIMSEKQFGQSPLGKSQTYDQYKKTVKPRDVLKDYKNVQLPLKENAKEPAPQAPAPKESAAAEPNPKKEQENTNPSSEANRQCECYLTTACTKSKGLPDDCEELTTLRRFRDNYMMFLPEGPGLIKDYYNFAPLIVEAIDKEENAITIYDEIYNIISQCVALIKVGKNEGAMKLYMNMARNNAAKYISAKPHIA